MKKKICMTAIGLISLGCLFGQQSATGNDPSGAASGTNSQQYWSRAGNTSANGTNNIFGTKWNSPIYTITNGNVRMITMAGGVGANDGRIAIGNNLAGNFQPVNRFHLHQNGAGNYGIQFTNSSTSAIPFAPTSTEGFAMNYISWGRFDFQQFNNQNVRFITQKKYTRFHI